MATTNFFGWTESEKKVQERLEKRNQIHDARLAAAFPRFAEPVQTKQEELTLPECLYLELQIKSSRWARLIERLTAE